MNNAVMGIALGLTGVALGLGLGLLTVAFLIWLADR
jgi:hypothetical protein